MPETNPISQPEIDCQGSLPEAAVRGLEHFNAGEYFEAHEMLEAAWRAEEGSIRDLYRGVLQVAVTYYHIQHHNYAGAIKLIARLRKWLEPFPDTCQGINLARLREDVDRVETELHRLGPERIANFDSSFFRQVEFQSFTQGK
jgi:predicted metal-dependent hydrolase